MLSSFLENVQTNETPLFKNSENLRTLKANLSFLSRIYTPNLSKLEELCIFYDAFNAQLLNNFFSSSDLSALRILKIEKEQSIVISFENLWKITIDILRKIKQQDGLKQYFEQQKFLICNQFYKLFDVKLKSVLLSLRYPLFSLRYSKYKFS